MIEVVDRVAQNPGQFTLRHEDGTTEIVTLERNDNPVVPGTPLNKALFDSIKEDLKKGVMPITKANYDKLSEAERKNGTVYNTYDDNGDPFKAQNIDYKNGKSVKDGLDELDSLKLNGKIDSIQGVGATLDIPNSACFITAICNNNTYGAWITRSDYVIPIIEPKNLTLQAISVGGAYVYRLTSNTAYKSRVMYIKE